MSTKSSRTKTDLYGWQAIMGLNKLEGNKIVNYRYNPLKEGTIPGGQVRDILEMESGKIWIAALKLAVFDPIQKTFTTFQMPDSIPELSFANAIVQEQDGHIWVGSNTGLYQFTLNGHWNRFHMKISHFTIHEDSNKEDLIYALAIGKDNTLWVGTYSDGLHRFDLQTKAFEKIVPEDNETAYVLSGAIWDIIRDSNNDLWVSTLSGLAIWEDGDDNPKQLESLGENEFDFKKRYPIALGG